MQFMRYTNRAPELANITSFILKRDYCIDLLEGRASTKFLKKYIKSFPCFSLNDEGEEQREEFNFDVLIDVARLKEGVGFGELALLNDAPRSATIRSVTDTHFATLEKEDFKLVLGKVLKKKFAGMLRFMAEFNVFKNMNRIAMEKLALFMK